jgi:hypothetical protein
MQALLLVIASIILLTFSIFGVLCMLWSLMALYKMLFPDLIERRKLIKECRCKWKE